MTHASKLPWIRLVGFLGEVRRELVVITWPARRELIAYSIVVLVAVVTLGALVFGLDILFTRMVARLFAL